MVSNKNILIAQGGGPTNVINQSLVGIIQQENNYKSKILGSINGVNGIINNRFISLNKISDNDLKIIANTPGAALGSTRDKPDKKYCKEILTILQNKKISKFYYIGGNDSSDSLRIISEYAKDIKYNLQCFLIPNTIDNDLVCNDHTPGFGSAAKYVAQLFSGINYDVKSLPGVYLGIVMGRHAGWIAAAGELANQNGSHVHKILLPEVPFDETKFLNGISNDVEKDGFSVVIASEGLKNSSGELYSASKVKDSFGHTQLGGLAPKLAELVNKNLNIKYHWSVSDYLQRSARHISSKTDVEQAIAVGEVAANMAADAKSGYMPIIKRLGNEPYKWEIDVGDLNEIANKEKVLPDNFISNCGFRITDEGVSYLSPLIQGESYPKYKNGLPAYEQLDLHF